ncbi:MAG: NAD-dependent epimerase/dehydratase family protein [Anaerolineales bacterium]|nr:NAD-dependent epimerase/dehydratase family protein [Anaerolineales bacterium]
MSPRALVTGGAGFIGSHVIDELLRLGFQVVALDDLSGGFRDNVAPAAEFVEGSILDAALIDHLFAQHQFDYVYHLAAYAAEGLSHFIKRFNYQNNLIGSVNLINAAVNYQAKVLVFTSSIAVYGANQLPMTEDLTPQPEDSYGIAKYAVELELAASRHMFGLDYIIFRPHNVYGERQNIGDKYRNVIGIFMNQIMQGQPLTVFGDGEQTRAFSYIGDVAPAIARSVQYPRAYGQIFNVGADVPYSVNQLARAVMQALGREVPLNHLPARNEVKHAYSSHAKFAEYFPAGAACPLEGGLAAMAAWALRAGPRQSREFGEIEIERNLPPSWARAKQ